MTRRLTPQISCDVNVLHTAGLESALLLPLLAKGRAVGTLNVVSRQRGAFHQEHVDALLPIAEIFAVAYVAQQLQVAVGKYQTMEAMSELTLSIAAESTARCRRLSATAISSSAAIPIPIFSAIWPRSCGRRSGSRPARTACAPPAQDRLKEMAAAVNQGGIPSSPEAYGKAETR